MGLQARRHLHHGVGKPGGPDTSPLSIRRPVGGAAVAGETVGNTVLLARSSRTADTAAAQDSVSQNGMQPTNLRVPVGTTVTFRNPGPETFPNFPNLKPHCATQFFEGEFNVELQPGETYQHTFTVQASTSSTTAPIRGRPARSRSTSSRRISLTR